MPELEWIWTVMAYLRQRLSQAHTEQRGYSTEAVVVTALFVTLAIAAAAIITAKVLSSANSIQTK
jgi:hypothetical protein